MILAGLTLIILAWFLPAKEETIKERLEIGRISLEVEVADTSEERARGLSGRENLSENQGMLFIFESADYHSFWMKDMIFAIDIIWIGEDKKIVDITKNAKQESYPASFRPKSPAKYVLEVNAGFSDRHKIKIGDLVLFTAFDMLRF